MEFTSNSKHERSRLSNKNPIKNLFFTNALFFINVFVGSWSLKLGRNSIGEIKYLTIEVWQKAPFATNRNFLGIVSGASDAGIPAAMIPISVKVWCSALIKFYSPGLLAS